MTRWLAPSWRISFTNSSLLSSSSTTDQKMEAIKVCKHAEEKFAQDEKRSGWKHFRILYPEIKYRVRKYPARNPLEQTSLGKSFVGESALRERVLGEKRKRQGKKPSMRKHSGTKFLGESTLGESTPTKNVVGKSSLGKSFIKDRSWGERGAVKILWVKAVVSSILRCLFVKACKYKCVAKGEEVRVKKYLYVHEQIKKI